MPLPARTCSAAPGRPSGSRRAARAAGRAARSRRRAAASSRRATRELDEDRHDASAADRGDDPAIGRCSAPRAACGTAAGRRRPRRRRRRLDRRSPPRHAPRQPRTGPGDGSPARAAATPRARAAAAIAAARIRSRVGAAVAVRQVAVEEHAAAAVAARASRGATAGAFLASPSRRVAPAGVGAVDGAGDAGVGDPRASPVTPDSDPAGGSVRIADWPARRSGRASRRGTGPESRSVRMPVIPRSTTAAPAKTSFRRRSPMLTPRDADARDGLITALVAGGCAVTPRRPGAPQTSRRRYLMVEKRPDLIVGRSPPN